jgi:hypothetical protein
MEPELDEPVEPEVPEPLDAPAAPGEPDDAAPAPEVSLLPGNEELPELLGLDEELEELGLELDEPLVP